MKSISSKLLLAMVGLTGMVLIATLLLARWSFEQGFIDYVSALEQRRLANMAEDLRDLYLKNNSQWAGTSADELEKVFNKWNPSAGARAKPGQFPPGTLGDRPPPWHDKSNRDRQKFKGRRPPPTDLGGQPRGDRPPPPGLPEKIESSRTHPTMLVDEQGLYVAGKASLPQGLHTVKVPVLVGNMIVGELRTVAEIRADSSLESKFSEQQTRASVFISIASLLLAGLASWILVRMLVAPVLQMKQGVVKLASGEYSSRLSADRNDELGSLMSDIDRLAETLEQNQSSRKRWLADISHELRTPVTILAGEIDAIKDGLRPMDMKQLESFDHEVARLRHLINDLYELSLSDIGGLRYEFSLLDPVELLEKVLDQNQSRINQAELSTSMTVASRASIDADASRLEQLFINLINNSIAYTDKPGKLNIAVRTEGQTLSIEFDDTAPGVSDSAFEQIFNPLFREDESRSRRVAGAGLGLTISKNIVIAHQGEISASPSSLGGVSIRLAFPIGNR